MYLFGALSLSMGLCAQDRAIGIVYDNSLSMKGGQHQAVSYSLQVLVGVVNPNDELFVNTMTICEKFDPQKAKVPYKTSKYLNYVRSNYCRYNDWLENKETAFTEIQEIAVELYNPMDPVVDIVKKLNASTKEEKWLIFLGDGEWPELVLNQPNSYLSKNYKSIENFINSTGAQVIYLNIDKKPNAPNNNLKLALQKISGIQPLYAPANNPGLTSEHIESISKQIMGIPKDGLKYKVNGSTVEIKSKVPLKRIVVLDQQGPSNLPTPKIIDVSVNGDQLFIPPMLHAKSIGNNGFISEIGYQEYKNKLIPDGKLVIEFAEDISNRKIKFLPEVAAKLVVEAKGEFKSTPNAKSKFYTSCPNQNIQIIARIVDLNGKPLQNLNDENVNIKAIVGKANTSLSFDKTLNAWTTDYPMKNEDLKFSVSAYYEGYFDFLSNIITVKPEKCETLKSGLKAGNASISVKVTELKNAQSVKVYPEIIETNGGPKRKPTDKEFNRLFLDKTNSNRLGLDIQKMDDHWLVKPSSYICACFTATGQQELVLKLGSSNKSITPTDGSITISVNIIDVSFLEKCGIIILAALLALILLWYFIGMAKKDRFARGSEITYYRKTKSRKGKEFSYGLPTNFFNRYLIPYLPEKKTIEGVTFRAGKTTSYIFLPKKSQEKDMYISGNSIDPPKYKDVRISKMEVLEIVHTKRTDNYRYDLIR